MTQDTHAAEAAGSGRHSAGGKSGNGLGMDGAAAMGDFFQGLDPQKIFSFVPGKQADLGPVFEANLDLMRAFDGMFQSWAAGFSSRNQERIQTMEECLKCSSQAEMVKAQNECMQRLTKHWMADNQKLVGIFFDAMGKAAKQNNGLVTAAMKKAADKLKTV